MFGQQKNRLTPQEQREFFEIIGNFVETGLTVSEGVQAFQGDAPKGSYIYRMCSQLLKDMNNGFPFSEALKKFPKSFPPFTVGVISMAENTSNLTEALKEISFRQELQNDIASKVHSATLVPKIAGLFGIAAFLFASLWAIPRMGETLKAMNTDLPLITQLVLLLGEAMQSFWPLLLILGIGLFLGYQWLKENRPEILAKFLLKIPFWKPITFNRVRYDFCTMMGICIDSGIKPEEALSYTAMATDNLFLKDLIHRSLRHVRTRGVPFNEALEKEDRIPLLDTKLYRFLRAGYKTGRTGTILRRQSEFYRKKLLAATSEVGDKVGMTVISPIYAMVAIMVVAIVLPIMGLATNAATKAF